MSAYVVEDVTMQRAVAAVRVVESGISDPMTCEAADKLGRDLYRLNCEAVAYRYPDSDDGSVCGQGFRFKLTQYSRQTSDNAELVPLYKALRCVIYQCTEGDAETTDLYRRVDSVSNDLAAKIVGNLPEYEAAEWG